VPKAVISFKEMKEKTPTMPGKKSTSAIIYLPPSWAGKKVAVFLLDEKIKMSD
jgi:hypothetical protein